MRSLFSTGWILCLAGYASSQSVTPEAKLLVGQAVADEMKNASSASIAFFPDAYLRDGLIPREVVGKEFQSFIVHPNEVIWLVTLSGNQIKAALERSVSYYPQASASFLHISGLSVSIDTAKSERVQTITYEGSALDLTKNYRVALPASLARGGLGYFSVWEFSKAERTVSSNLAKLLEGKTVQQSGTRWQFKGSSQLF
jgi:2',3'-cyclic-nucleotide 2'-phosphodiesterase (5'-nucleotidase family)